MQKLKNVNYQKLHEIIQRVKATGHRLQIAFGSRPNDIVSLDGESLLKLLVATRAHPSDSLAKFLDNEVEQVKADREAIRAELRRDGMSEEEIERNA